MWSFSEQTHGIRAAQIANDVKVTFNKCLLDTGNIPGREMLDKKSRCDWLSHGKLGKLSPSYLSYYVSDWHDRACCCCRCCCCHSLNFSGSEKKRRSSRLWRNYGNASESHWICLQMRWWDQHKLHCSVEHVFPGCFSFYLSLLIRLPPPPSSPPCLTPPPFPFSLLSPGSPRAGLHQWFSKGS